MEPAKKVGIFHPTPDVSAPVPRNGDQAAEWVYRNVPGARPTPPTPSQTYPAASPMSGFPKEK